MKVEQFDFDLPEHLIAQTPSVQRGQSRLLCLNKANGHIQHHMFQQITQLLEPGDTLVFNDTQVIPARLFGVKAQTGAKVEVLLLKQVLAAELTEAEHNVSAQLAADSDIWEVLVKPGKKVTIGTWLHFGGQRLTARCIGYTAAGGRLLAFYYEGIWQEILEELGEMPLPPYIKEQLQDRERYQTVYAKQPGSVAAPTAGLHFTPEILQAVQERGIRTVFLTLHVGLGTFRPVQVDEVADHHMHAEYFELSAESARLLSEAQQGDGRIIAVGTTSVRTLETVLQKYGQFKACSGWTDIFIYPGYTFRALDGLLTNFHLPRSTLLMLISAWAGRDHVFKAYAEAIREEYRFFSFGDAMLIL